MILAIINWNSLQSASLIHSPVLAFFHNSLMIGLPSNLEPIINKVNWEAFYLAGTFIVGVLIAYEALALRKNNGKLPTNLLFNFSSITETTWMLITITMLYIGNFSSLPKAVAAAYLLYGIFGWVYSFYLLKDQALEIDDIEDVAMPAKFMNYSLSFAWVITLISMAFLIMLYHQGKFYIGF